MDTGEASGRRIGPYVLGPVIGRGASGVVYEAADEKLRRKVALKVLAEGVARTPEQRARFDREARLLAAVRHQNVAVVYGVVEEGEELWLALEYLEGETLAEALQRGPLPMEEALDVARQIAAGLEAAHECGVIHRDLKPANTKRTSDGTVKVLDFGLARPAGKDHDASSEISTEGLAIGTPLYMSPEQLRGRGVDRRADVWAFGCVLWELLCGRRAFGAPTTPEILHAILELDPDESRLPEATPTRVRELLRRCLTKDPRQRLRDVGDARLELETALAERAWARSGGDVTANKPRTSLRTFAGVAVLAAALGAWFGRQSERPDDPRVLRMVLAVPPGERRTYPRVSPDGRTLVHEVASKRGPERRYLVARALDSFEDVPIAGSERVDTYGFSSDGERLAVVRVSEGVAARCELALLRMDGSEPPVFVGVLPENLSTGGSVAWLEDGRVVLSTRPRGLLLVHTDGSGRMDEVPVVCREQEWPDAPDILGDLGGSRVLASSFHLSGRTAYDSVVAIDVETGQQTVLVENSSCAAWQPPGELLFSRADVLFRAPVDLETLSVGAPVPLASGLSTELAWKSADFGASREGTIAWWPSAGSATERRLSLLEGSSDPRPWSDDALPLEGFLQSDLGGTFITLVVVSPAGNYELWGSELDEPNLRALLADKRFDYRGGCALPDRRELYASRVGPAGTQLVRTSLDAPGECEVLYENETDGHSLQSIAVGADGRTLTVREFVPDGIRLLAFDVTADAPFAPRTLFEGGRSWNRVGLSPDGRWLLVGGWREVNSIRRVDQEGSSKRSWIVPTPGVEVVSMSWARPSADEPPGLLLWSEDSRTVHRVDLVEDGGAPQFSAPRRLVELAEGTFWDAAHVGSDRFLAILGDPGEFLRDRVHLLIGADALARPAGGR